MTANNSNTGKKLSLLELANEALAQEREGATVASTAVRVEGISDAAFRALETKALADTDLGKDLMSIAKARNGVAKNPAAWRAFLSERLKFAANEDHPDPRKVIALMRGALSKYLPQGEGAAYPLFSVPAKGTEGKWNRRIYLPRIARDKESGKLHCHGVMIIVPATGNDQDLANLRAARTKAAAEFVDELEGELLANVRGKVWTACWLFPEASIYSKELFEKFFEKIEGNLFTKRGRREKFRHFALSDNEHFVVMDGSLAGRLVAALEAIEVRVGAYWADKLGADELIGGILLQHPAEAISPDQFQRGVPGVAAVLNPHWKLTAGKKKGKEESVTALFQRRENGEWKCLICTLNGAESLFGKTFRFHEWEDGEIPPHLQAFLRNGEQVEANAEEV